MHGGVTPKPTVPPVEPPDGVDRALVNLYGPWWRLAAQAEDPYVVIYHWAENVARRLPVVPKSKGW